MHSAKRLTTTRCAITTRTTFISAGQSATWRAVLLLLTMLCSLAAGAQLSSVTELDSSLRSAQTRLKDLQSRFTDRHPDVLAAQRLVNELKAARDIAAEAVHKNAPASSTTSTLSVSPASSVNPPEVVPPPPLASARAARKLPQVSDFAALCKADGVLACFDFEGDAPLRSRVGAIRGELSRVASGGIPARIVHGDAAHGSSAVRMDFHAQDNADHGSFVVTADAFGQGDLLTVQWRQWLSPELITTFSDKGEQIRPPVGGDGTKQLGISEIGDSQGCTYGQVVMTNLYWSGVPVLYHGCGLWFIPRGPVPAAANNPNDYDLQPGGDVVCRYQYLRGGSNQRVDYLYPTTPANLLSVRGLATVFDAHRYHGCLGLKAGQWMTFRIEMKIDLCKEQWTEQRVPERCAGKGSLRLWIKYADESKPWLAVDYPVPLRWQPGSSGRYGRFNFTPYNTNEKPFAEKPAAYTIYDDIVIARNNPNLPWPAK